MDLVALINELKIHFFIRELYILKPQDVVGKEYVAIIDLGNGTFIPIRFIIYILSIIP